MTPPIPDANTPQPTTLRERIKQGVLQADDEEYLLTDAQLDAIVNIVNDEKVRTRKAWEFLGNPDRKAKLHDR